MFKKVKKAIIAAIAEPVPTAVIDYLLNDPLTPELKVSMEVPLINESPQFCVQGWNGYAVSEIQKQSAQVYACMNSTMNMVKSYWKAPLKWSNAEVLVANPRAGKAMNAFYNRAALNFFYAEHPVTKKTVFTADSVNVVAHELGHAILDAIRPDLWHVQSLEIFAFHESFGDIISMLSTLQHDLVIDYLLKETNNNPRNSNCVSRIAEEMGDFIYANGGRNVEANALRNAATNFKYVQPETLPAMVKDLSLSQEPHSFSRVFTSVWFNCFVDVYEHEVKTVSPHDALKKARDIMANITINSLPLAAVNPKFYKAFAKAMLGYTQGNYENSYFNILRKNFLQNKIIDGMIMDSNSDNELDLSKVGSYKLCDLGNKIKNIRSGEVETSSLLELSRQSLRYSGSFLPMSVLKAKIQCPFEGQYVLGGTRVIDRLPSNRPVVADAVRKAIEFLHLSDHISENVLDNDKCFCIENGELSRRRSCLDRRGD